MSRPLEKPLSALKSRIPDNAKILVAVSGGLDSISLLDCCNQLKKSKKLHIEVAHVDHGLRKESSADASFVAEFCKKLDLVCYQKKLSSVPAHSNIEAWARKERYSFFSQLLSKRKLEMVLTAHSANDLAETLLMRLIANKELNLIQAFDTQRSCLRPWLTVTREAICEYARIRKLRWVEDKSNEDTKLLRNRVRKRLLPFLEKEFEPRIVEILAHRGLAILEDNALVSELLNSKLSLVNPITKADSHTVWLASLCSTIKESPSSLNAPLIVRAFKPHLGYNLSRAKTKEVMAVFLNERVATQLPQGWYLKRSKGVFSLQKIT